MSNPKRSVKKIVTFNMKMYYSITKLFQLFQSQKLYIGQWVWCLQKRLGQVELTNERPRKI